MSNENELLEKLSETVTTEKRKINKKHNIWEQSFDWKFCETDKFIIQKLDYIHQNPKRGRYDLCENIVAYKHSSAKYYYANKECYIAIKRYSELHDFQLE